MSVAVVTGAAGLVGSAAARHFAARGMHVVGVDNCMRETFFGADGSVRPNLVKLERDLGTAYTHCQVDVRDRGTLDRIFQRYGADVTVVVHAAAQPSHNWAGEDPRTDFDINAVGTLNVLDNARLHCPDAVVIHCSSSTVYGDHVNSLPFVERESRWDLPPEHPYYEGTPETAPIDHTKHTLFGVSKLSADVMAQEFGRYYGLRTAVLRSGLVCGPELAATMQHGMPGFVLRSLMEGRPYVIKGFGGKQVRDALHTSDLLAAFDAVIADPRPGEAYNLGGSRANSCSVLEVIALAQDITGLEMQVSFAQGQREGDRRWWITNNRKFMEHFPHWRLGTSLRQILVEIHEANADRWTR
ncbi:NAD-dependent epimerase/dehydratase family protein [Catellatospora chokoriensis]|uniref:NAD-dependent epimerase n=1 Tax=Catellatospora chokoriensis TaxID=310353 RepID=A0A8J3JXJ5_9ACTN|nr:NAD-dependent epimerase/dehydratase family protein [Catellatospora chokoriensis]GIF90314.1 NAD-dependent epimerase [Catellatospora chokoriensis]